MIKKTNQNAGVNMKTFIILAITMISFSSFGADKVTNLETGKSLAISLEEAEYKNLGKKLDLQLFSATEKDNKIKVELGIGTKIRPARMHDCITVTFSDAKTGYIQNIEKEIDAGSCEF
jgi:hypothetical protein